MFVIIFLIQHYIKRFCDSCEHLHSEQYNANCEIAQKPINSCISQNSGISWNLIHCSKNHAFKK